MSQNVNNQSAKTRSFKAIGMAGGMIIGGIVGYFIDNMIIFAGFGLVLGLAIGAALDARHNQEGA